MKSILCGLFCFIFFGSVFAGTVDNANTSGKQLAQQLNSSKYNNAAANINPASAVPGYAGSNVSATQYYNSADNITSAGETAAASDPNAQYIKNSITTRPTVKIDNTKDPLVKNLAEINTKAGGLSTTYSGCVDLPISSTSSEVKKTCYTNSYTATENYTCTKKLNVYCTNTDAGEPKPFYLSNFQVSGASLPGSQSGDTFSFGSQGNNRGGSCKHYVTYIKFYVDNIDWIRQFTLDYVQYDDWLDVKINDVLKFRGIGGNQGINVSGKFSCEQHRQYSNSSSVDLTPHIKTGWNTITVDNLVKGGGNAYIRFTARRYVGCTEKTAESWSCPNGKTHTDGTLISPLTCTDSNSTKQIQGVDITKSCWAWSATYQGTTTKYKMDNNCNNYVSQGCGQVSNECVSKSGNICTSQKLTFSCPVTNKKYVSLCGSQLYCPNGGCTSDVGQTSEDATSDFKEAATALAVANEIATNMNKDTLTVFNGQELSCRKSGFGFSDCCADGGWGQSAGLASCNEQEKLLGQAKADKQVIFVRSKTSGFIIKKTTKYYCKYPSKLSRIIIAQGKAQLHQSIDDSCRGFTMDELSQLNFDAMDFSEYLTDVQNKINNQTTPSGNSAADAIKSKLQTQYGVQQ